MNTGQITSWAEQKHAPGALYSCQVWHVSCFKTGLNFSQKQEAQASRITHSKASIVHVVTIWAGDNRPEYVPIFNPAVRLYYSHCTDGQISHKQSMQQCILPQHLQKQQKEKLSINFQMHMITVYNKQ